MSLSAEYFSKIEMKVGRILEVEDIAQARKPMYRMKIDFGREIGVKQCVGGIKAFYSKEDLVGKQVVAVLNLQPKSVAGVISECMVLASFNDEIISLLRPDKEMPLGTKVA
ncbi:MAG: tRNA-binding protein [Thaumarchaeota archaeon]|nr:tRNA-binding protein [Nitrososphaerota archaeon]